MVAIDGEWLLVLTICILALGYATIQVFFHTFKIGKQDTDNEKDNGGTPKKKRHGSGGESKKQARLRAKAMERVKPGKYGHRWLVATLKGHTGKILDFELSSNNKLLASCADDRTIHVWVIKDFGDKEHKSYRVNIPYDYATMVRFSPDNKAFIASRKEDHCVEVFKINRKPDNSIAKVTGNAAIWNQPHPTPPTAPNLLPDYVGIGVACTGKFVLSCWTNGRVELRNVKGYVLSYFYCRVKKPICAKITPCGRYIAIAGSFEIDVYTITVNQDTRTAESSLKWTLNPDISAPITDISFNMDSSKVALVTDNGSWMIYDTTGNRTNIETQGAIDVEIEDCVTVKPVLQISPDSRIVVVGMEHSVYFFSAFSGNKLGEVLNVFKGSVTRVGISADCKSFIISGDSTMYIFKNVCWICETIERLKGQLSDGNLTLSLRERLSSELASYEEELAQLI